MTKLLVPLLRLAFAASTTLAGAATALAAPPTASTQAQARYRHDMTVCNSGQSNQSADTCRREAASALAAANRGTIHNDPGQYQRNALQRCQVHHVDDRIACEARMLDQGDITTDTQAGGVLRQSITVTPAP